MHLIRIYIIWILPHINKSTQGKNYYYYGLLFIKFWCPTLPPKVAHGGKHIYTKHHSVSFKLQLSF